MSRTRAFLALVAVAASLSVCGGGDWAPHPAGSSSPNTANPPGELRTITFMAGFRAQANLPFVAVYLADAKGYFAEEGLRVEVKHSAGQDEHLKLLLAKEIVFTTATGAQALIRHADGLPVRAVALFGQRGDQGFVARADS